jgi:S-adenosylmethionine-diacylgycerolhomoserine-N-methlytransferase
VSAEPAAREEHRRFLNRYYGLYHHVYDLLRKYYLFGRDGVLEELLAEPWERLVEVGPGTGRNLRKLHAGRPTARLGGVDASDVMLAHARARCPWATLTHGFAEDADMAGLLGARPDRVLFSYCLSMVGDKDAALRNARAAVAPGGEVVVVDFADLSDLPEPLRGALRGFLGAYHVATLDEGLLARHGARLRWGPGRYYVVGHLPGQA